MDRRQVLAGIGGLALAGCLALGNATRVGRIAVANFTTSPVSVAVAVLEDGSAVYDETHDIEGNDPDSIVVPSVSIIDELPDEPGQYVIEYGLAGAEPKSFDFSEQVDSDCGQVHVDVREGFVELFFSSNCDTLDYDTTD